MANTIDSNTPLPAKRPVMLLVFAVLLLGLAALLTPSVLVALGPMRGSLTHPNELVRRTTRLELNAIRAMCLAMAVVLILVAARWRAFVNSRFVAGVLAQPLDENTDREQRRVNNASLWLMLVALVAWVVYLKFGAYVFSPKVLGIVNREDGVIEGGTALSFLVASVASAAVAFRARYRPRKVFAAILALGFFMCMGEEMSWGQHLFGWKAPEAITKVNVQGETNLHNLSGYFADHVFIAGTLLFGAVVPVVAAVSPVWRRVFDRFGIIVGSLGLAVGFFLVTLNQPYLLGKWIGHKDSMAVIDPAAQKARAAGNRTG